MDTLHSRQKVVKTGRTLTMRAKRAKFIEPNLTNLTHLIQTNLT